MPQIMLAAALLAPPDCLFAMYLDPDAHAAVAGAPVTISPWPGAPFRAFDGMLTGTILHVESPRLIVQTWRSAQFPADALDSVLVLSI